MIGDGLRLHRAHLCDADLVFTKTDGNAIHPDLFTQAFDRRVRRIDVPRIRLHDLRHTHASLLLQAGVSPKVVSERLGHATVRFTMQVYAPRDPRDASRRGRGLRRPRVRRTRRRLITRVPHFNSVSNYMASETLMPVLHDLILATSIPLRALEADFAVDSTGFTTSRFIKWHDEKHGVAGAKHQKECVKAHVMVGTRANVVTSIELSDCKGGDTTYFAPLVQQTAKDWDVTEISADKAYLTKSNCELVEQVGATPYIPFKSNTRPVLNCGTAWERMYHRFAAEPEKFASSYHKRSNVETTFSMIKGKFGDSVLSKSPVGQADEVLCEVLAHNIVVVGQAAIEFGIDPTFGTAV